ncbi:MAG: DUF4339 domain-containing protein [Thermoguttaceae bacterium]
MADQWYYAHQGQQAGPVSTEQLRELAASGRLQPGDLVWKQGMAAWAAASTVEGLFAAPAAGGATPGPAGIPPQPAGTAPPQVPPIPGLRVALPDWSPGAWVIVGSVALAVVSLLFKWTGVPEKALLREMARGLGGEALGSQILGDSYVSHVGLLNPWVMLVGVFVYPVWMLLAGRPIHLVGGILCGAWGAVSAMFWIVKLADAANWGMYIYLVACLALIVGAVLYKPTGWRLLR